MEATGEKGRATFEGWCVLELMGHRKLGGYVQEVTLAGAGFLRVDVPNACTGAAATWCPKHGDCICRGLEVPACPLHGSSTDHGAGVAATQLYPPSAVYCLTPTTEENARGLAARNQVQPVAEYELPRRPALGAPPTVDFEREDDDVSL